MSDHVITPPDETAMTVESADDGMTLVTVERGNGDSIQAMKLTAQERGMLAGMLDSAEGPVKSMHATFRSLPDAPVVRGAGGNAGAALMLEHSGMGVCNKGRRHEPPCDYGYGV